MEACTMWSRRRLIIPLAVVGLIAGLVGCTNDTLDDGDSPDNVLEVESFAGPQATAALQGGGGGGTSACLLRAVDWTMTLRNVPKSVLAGGDSIPFNTIVLDGISVTYQWAGSAPGPASGFIGLAGVAIEPEGTASIAFLPIGSDALAVDGDTDGIPDLSGSSAVLYMVVRGHTEENEQVTLSISAVLNIQVCPPATP